MSEDKKRFYFIDQFRGWAVLFMVETHVVNAFLHHRPALLAGLQGARFLQRPDRAGLPVHRRLLVRHRGRAQVGRFPAPGQGLLETVPALPADPAGRLPAARAALFAALPFPYPEMEREKHLLGRRRAARHRRLAAADAAFHPALAAQRSVISFSWPPPAVAVSLLTPLLLSLPVEKILPWAFSGYLKRLPFSQFPLFPWMGFAFLGAAVSRLWQEARRRRGRSALLPPAFLSPALSLVAVFFIIALQPFVPVVLGSFNPAKPLFFFLKLGLVRDAALPAVAARSRRTGNGRSW